MARIILILGGARSGKSSYAEKLASGLSENVLYVAPAVAYDDDMRRRIAAHRQARPATWRTLESSHQLASPLAEGLGTKQVVLIDCLTMWVSNVLMDHPDFPFHGDKDTTPLQQKLSRESEQVLALARERDITLIAVSNEVGLGVSPPYPSGHVFREILGRINQIWAAGADEVYLVVAGIPLRIKGQGSEFGPGSLIPDPGRQG